MKLSDLPVRLVRLEHEEPDQRKAKGKDPEAHRRWQEANRYLRKWRAKRSRDAGEL